MKSTADLRNKLFSLWGDFEKGRIDSLEARTHIGFAKAAIDTLKLEISAANVTGSIIEPVAFTHLSAVSVSPEVIEPPKRRGRPPLIRAI